MKTRILALACVLACLSAAAAQQVVKARTAAEFVRAIGPNRVIELQPGTYDLSQAASVKSKYVSWDRSSGDPELTIVGVEGLTVSGQGATLVTPSPWTHVLRLEDCTSVTLRGLTIGHEVTEGCMEGVLLLSGCADCLVEECELFGSGAVGLELEYSDGISVSGGAIRDCSYGAIWMMDTYTVGLSGLSVAGNGGGFPLLGLDACHDVSFSDCSFEGNEGDTFLAMSEDSEEVGFTFCSLTDNDFATFVEAEYYPELYELDYAGNSFDEELDEVVAYGGEDYGEEGAASFLPYEVPGSGLMLFFPEWFSLDDSNPARPVLYETDPAEAAVRIASVYTLAKADDPDTQAERIFRKALPLAEKWLAQAGTKVTRRLEELPVNTEAPPYHFECWAEGFSGKEPVVIRMRLVQGAGAVWCFAAVHPDRELLEPDSAWGLVLDGVSSVEGGE